MKGKQLYLFLTFIFVAIVSCTEQVTYVEEPPNVDHQQFNIAENSPEGTIVGAITVENSQNRNLSFHLVKTENSNAFRVDKKTGIIQVQDSSFIDFELIQQIDLEIMISYETTLNEYAIFPIVTVSIIDEPENFEITLNSSSGNSFDGVVSSLSSEQIYNGNEFLYISAWTSDLVSNIQRSFIHFDLSLIPKELTITGATLYLYNPNDAIAEHEHSQLTGDNEFIIALVSSIWNSETLTWNNQPSFSLENNIEVDSTLNATQNIQVNVTGLINEVYQNQPDYFGIALSLKDEAYYRRICFASMNNKDVELRPKLTISYLK